VLRASKLVFSFATAAGGRWHLPCFSPSFDVRHRKERAMEQLITTVLGVAVFVRGIGPEAA